MFEYIPKGTCSSKISFEIKSGKLFSVIFKDGCDGNLKAVGRLLEGMDAKEAAKKLKGINCGGKGTSCADQLAAAILSYI
ncbi:MAG: TIGR03905 family TSCPD domain-containing protein [Treponema sp.]|jgi:uncharacterized protein (TIGR03905 family)|nr:TIGR03905 family TSCPD domain-containing protein [Treponema sp.]